MPDLKISEKALNSLIKGHMVGRELVIVEIIFKINLDGKFVNPNLKTNALIMDYLVFSLKSVVSIDKKSSKSYQLCDVCLYWIREITIRVACQNLLS